MRRPVRALIVSILIVLVMVVGFGIQDWWVLPLLAAVTVGALVVSNILSTWIMAGPP